MLENIIIFLTQISEWSFSYWWLIAVVGAYLYLCYHYWRKAKQAKEMIYFAPISVKGGMWKQFGAREAGLLLRAQLSKIIETFQKDRTEHTSIYMLDVGSHLRSLREEYILHEALVSAPIEFSQSEIVFKEELVVKIGTIQIPIGAIFNLFVSILRVLPVLFRRRYLAALIHVSLVSTDGETQLLVFREGRLPWLSGKTPPDEKREVRKHATVLTRIGPVKSLADLNAMIREAAFMVLDLHGKAFPGRSGQSMRYFADGLEALDEYRQTGDNEFIVRAEKNFASVTKSDSSNFEALYFYGYLLLLRRTRESITHAIRVFTFALKTEEQKLRALIHAGLANCYAQVFHRLAKRETDVLDKTWNHAQEARREWEDWQNKQEPETKELHPWIFSTLALVLIIDEGTVGKGEDAKNRFIESAGLYFQAIKREPDNGMLYNNLGWVLLKLAEWGIDELKVEDGAPPALSGNPAEKAEKYLLRSIELNPTNKLSHANLCLLYASPWFRADPEKYLDRCRYYGRKAIRIDPKYINGNRDLAVSLLRYEKFDEAYKYFEDALRLAVVVEKDQEIIGDVVKVLDEMKVNKKVQDRWIHPDPKLLEPPDTNDTVPQPIQETSKE